MIAKSFAGAFAGSFSLLMATALTPARAADVTNERLRITGVQTGSYDAKLTDLDGRTCMVHGLKVEAGQIFSIDEKELTGCNR